MTISHERLLEILSYDPETGEFRWRTPRPKVRVGERAGHNHGRGYRYIEINERGYAEHRLAWFYMTGEWPKEQIDHRDRDRANNRFANLRQAAHGQNRANSKTSNRHGLKGVCYHSWLKDNPWEAAIRVGGKQWSLGCFPTKEQAHAAYQRAALEHHGEFAHF